MFYQLRGLCARVSYWLMSKKDEWKQLSWLDAFMARVVLEIVQTSPAPITQSLFLYQLLPIHPIDNRENTILATKERVLRITQRREELLRSRLLTKEQQNELIPSVTWIRVVPAGKNRYFCIEGNGRVAALKEVFTEQDCVQLEVDVFTPKRLRAVQRELRRLRKWHHLG